MTVPVVEGTEFVVDFWTFAEVERRLVEAMQFQWRMPGDGPSPFAADGPWHLIVPGWEEKLANLALGGTNDAKVPRIPLSKEQIGRMREAESWLVHAPEGDGKLIAMAIRNLAAGRKSVPWTKLLKPMGVKHGAHGLRKRYERAINAICVALNGAEMRA